MVDYDKIREIVVPPLAKYLGIPLRKSDQNAPPPSYPYGSYTITIFAGENNGTWEQHADGIDRKQVKQTWSLSFLAEDSAVCANYASKARTWFEKAGRTHLRDCGISVHSVTSITNRDNILTVEYEHKSGFDVVFYVYDEDKPTSEETNEIIESVELTRIE